jgi:sulfatase modifying factor 1
MGTQRHAGQRVGEWVQDGYGPYSADAVTDQKGPVAGALRVIQGGSWHDVARYVRTAYRNAYDPGDRHANLGFRCVSSGPSR